MLYLIALLCIGLLQGNLATAAAGKEKRIKLVNGFPDSFDYKILSKRDVLVVGNIQEDQGKYINVPEQEMALTIEISSKDGKTTSGHIKKNQHKVTLKPVVHLVLDIE